MSKIICLDAGHTPGIDHGAVGNGLQEAVLTGDIVDRIATKLAAYDCTVLRVPRTDSLTERCNYANSADADCFVSVHINAGGGTGFESYVYTPAGTEAIALQKAIHESCTAYGAQHGIVDRGKKTAAFTVLAKTDMPACLLELLFIDTAKDAALLKDEIYLNGIANAIAWGLVVYLGLTLRKKDTTEDAIAKLKEQGVINSPDYWLENARSGKSCKGEYVAALMRNMADKL